MSQEKCLINVADVINQWYYCETNVYPIKPPVELSIAIGKIRAVIPTGFFKDELLKQMTQIADLLQRGFVTEALLIISAVIEKVNHRNNSKCQFGFNLVVRELLQLKQAILEEFSEWLLLRCYGEFNA